MYISNRKHTDSYTHQLLNTGTTATSTNNKTASERIVALALNKFQKLQESTRQMNCTLAAAS